MPTFVNMTGPGTAVVTDDAAAAITLQTEALSLAITGAVATLIGPPGSVVKGTLNDIANKLDAINGNLSLMARESKAMSAAIGKVETATAATASAARLSTAIQSVAATDQMMTNERQKQVTNEALTRAGIKLPVLPDFEKIAEEKIKDALNFNAMMKAQGMITKALEDITEELQNYFKLVAKEFGITKYIQDKIDALKALVPDPALAAKKLQADTVVTTYYDA
jgi:hypothetical protein